MVDEKTTNLHDLGFYTSIREGIALVDFWAPWCGPCKMQLPVLEEVAADVKDKAKISKVNIDDDAHIAQRFGINAIPTLILFNQGNEVTRFIGLQNKEILISEIKKLLQD